MKKKVLMVLVLLIGVLLPLQVMAEEEKKYETLDFEEILKEEEIEPVFKEYKPKSDAITIYLFRGKGCGYCKLFLNFLNSITPEYGKYFVVESYEVWNNTDNKNLMAEVSDYMSADATGVPFIIIGNSVFTGYSAESDEKIKTAIKTLYDTDKNKRYDVFKEMKKDSKKIDSGDPIFNKYVIWLFIFLLISTIVIVSFVNLKFKELNHRLDEIENNKYYKKKKGE